ncbi:MAG: hypothetical protein D6740_03030 [Alphaproteobacteria bacterium]|nr:MAG: hypothetical protein D6740_03030 [Alphaproteobacteria bacterium]
MLFLVIARDDPARSGERPAHRDRHLAYLRECGARLKFAGPIRGEDDGPAGSVFLIEAASETAARLFAENDPYARAGIFRSCEILPVKPVMGAWLPANGS